MYTHVHTTRSSARVFSPESHPPNAPWTPQAPRARPTGKMAAAAPPAGDGAEWRHAGAPHHSLRRSARRSSAAMRPRAQDGAAGGNGAEQLRREQRCAGICASFSPPAPKLTEGGWGHAEVIFLLSETRMFHCRNYSRGLYFVSLLFRLFRIEKIKVEIWNKIFVRLVLMWGFAGDRSRHTHPGSYRETEHFPTRYGWTLTNTAGLW